VIRKVIDAITLAMGVAVIIVLVLLVIAWLL
jgi:hypothetical protein